VPSVLAIGLELAVTGSKKSSGGSPYVILVLIALVGGFYFLVLRPRSQRQRQARENLRQAKVGDEIATVGGLVGTSVAEDGDRVTVSTGNGTELVFLRQAIGRRLSPDTTAAAPEEPAAESYEDPPPGFDASASTDGAASGDEPEKG